MTLHDENQVRAFVGRDGSRWASMTVWQHRFHATIARYDLMRGLPDGMLVEDSPAWKRMVEARQRRLARWAEKGRRG